MRRFDVGHQVFHEVFTRTEMMRVLEALSVANLDRTKAGVRDVLRVPAVRDLSADQRMVQFANQFVGPTAVPFHATVFDKSTSANWLVVWHQDTALPLCRQIEHGDWGPWSSKAGVLYAHAPAWALEQIVALRVSLDDSSATNGPLRVLPDTHRDGVFNAAQIERLAREISPVDCLTASGGVIAMRPLTIHSSSKSGDRQRRRILHIEYAAALHVAPGVELAVG